MNYRVIKQNNVFLMTEINGDISESDTFGYGLYMDDTRFLSRMELFVEGRKPIVLSSSADGNYYSLVRLTNEPTEVDGRLVLDRECVEIIRKRFIYDDVLYDSIELTNYSPGPHKFECSLRFDADFKDMFMVRGYNSGKIAGQREVMTGPSELKFSYKGIDNIHRDTFISWDAPGSFIEEDQLVIPVELAPREQNRLLFYVRPHTEGRSGTVIPFDEAFSQLQRSYEEWTAACCQIDSDLPLLNKLFERSADDLYMLLTDLGNGPFPVAGVPWFAVPFGRDSLIAALQMMMLNPEVARGTLRTMAHFQGSKLNDWQDEEPGKIMHELRSGELAHSGQIPFHPYYGTIDATPLFLVLLAKYYSWTGDLSFAREMLPYAKRALDWIDTYGDRDGDGFVEYFQKSSSGLANQGWKDSSNSNVHRNGQLAEAPIALVEVQGYVYQAKRELAKLLRLLGEDQLADEITQSADRLKESFNEAYWMEEEQYFAIALDKYKNQVQSVTSNPGHILMSHIADSDKSQKVAQRLVSEDVFSGYGIRTMSTGSAGYNPMSYHNGSVWPHDNSMCLFGLAELGFQAEAKQVISALLKASASFEYNRLPELFCGYDEQSGYPVPYPTSCSPQAWAAGTGIVLVQAMLGIVPDAYTQIIMLSPILPDGVNRLNVSRIRIGEGELSLKLTRLKEETGRWTEEVDTQIAANTTGFTVKL